MRRDPTPDDALQQQGAPHTDSCFVFSPAPGTCMGYDGQGWGSRA